MMRISTSYLFLLCCALFVLLTCSECEKDPPPYPDEQHEKVEQVTQPEKVDDTTTPPPPPKNNEPVKPVDRETLSEESKKIYDAISPEFRQSFLNRFIKTTTTTTATTTRTSELTTEPDEKTIFSMLVCATFHMKSDSEKFYPEFEGATGKHRTKEVTKAYTLLMLGVKEKFEIPTDLAEMINDFAGVEMKFHVKPEHRANVKMINYFYDICGYLWRYTDKKVKLLLTSDSYYKAAALMRKIIEPGSNDAQKKAKIIEFATFYARVRHWSNRFAGSCLANLLDNIEELSEKEGGRKVMVYEVLDFMKILTPLRFSQDDVDRLNLIIEIIRRSKAKKYFHKSYKYSDLDKMITVLLPLVNLDECGT